MVIILAIISPFGWSSMYHCLVSCSTSCWSGIYIILFLNHTVLSTYTWYMIIISNLHVDIHLPLWLTQLKQCFSDFSGFFNFSGLTRFVRLVWSIFASLKQDLIFVTHPRQSYMWDSNRTQHGSTSSQVWWCTFYCWRHF